MTKRTNKKSQPFEGIRLIYKVFPFILLLLAAFNVWFLFSYVQRERITVDGVRDDVMRSVSNVFSYVSVSLSNRIDRIRMSDSMLSRPVFLGGSVSNSPPLSLSSETSENDLPLSRLEFYGDVYADFFRVNGEPFLAFSDGFRYGLGDDFGYGVIEQIHGLSVVCSGRRYRLRSLPRARSLPSFEDSSIPLRSSGLASSEPVFDKSQLERKVFRNE